MKCIKVIANKSWEADPLVDALLNSKFKPKDLPLPIVINRPCSITSETDRKPRLVYIFDETIIEVWCIEDQMNPAVSSSNTMEKIRILPIILTQYAKPDLVIAFGTAAYPGGVKNGSVISGSSFYIHNGNDPDNPDKWDGSIARNNYIGILIQRSLFGEGVNIFSEDDLTQIRRTFLSVPLYPDRSPDFNGHKDNLSVGDVNIITYALYDSQDPIAVDEAKRDVPGMNPVSVETTHAVIAASVIADTQAKVLFVSGIANEVGEFSRQVKPKTEAQNYTAAFNAGIVVAWMLPKLVSLMKADSSC